MTCGLVVYDPLRLPVVVVVKYMILPTDNSQLL